MSSTLDALPAELAAEICDFLNKADLLKIRQTSRFFNQVSVISLSKYLRPKLQSVKALLTEEGLRCLNDLTRVPQFCSKIENIYLADHKLYELDTQVDVGLGHFQSEALLNSVIPAQQHFDMSGQALALLQSIFANVKSSARLASIRIGYDIHLSRHDICGFSHLSRSLSLDNAQQYKYLRRISERATPWALRSTMSQPFLALQATNFSRRLVHLQLQKMAQPGLIVAERSSGSIARRTWNVVGPYLQSAHITAYDHREANPKSALWMKECTTAISGVDELQIRGSEDHYDECSGCTLIFQGLTKAKFSRIARLDLIDLCIDEQNLSRFLNDCSSTLQSLQLDSIGLICGSWYDVIVLIREFALSHLEAEGQYQLVVPGCIPHLYCRNTEINFVVSGRENVANYIQLWLDNWEVSRDNPHQGGELMYPTASYAEHFG
ncbi:hypothetical protein EJ04DRAFT_585293 [Polyplosphaeria fusca]|uniref:F-box domain-containing protein n=1 Tax=Polyplosphaeria fusca TaxID=682080 RepID=A0A9P4QSS3_9PLEO|nr:hypothetical protein EJ04DRAFT_585293 [Polyplosphaeria fusca]